MTARLFVFSCVVVLLVVVPATAKPFLTPPKILKSSDGIDITAQLEDWFTRPIVRVIQSGIPLQIIFIVKVYKTHEWWFDSTIYTRELKKQVQYEQKAGIYTLSVYNHKHVLVRQVTLDDLQAVEKAVKNMVMHIPLEDLQVYSQRNCYARIQAYMVDRYEFYRIPFSFKTGWAKSRLFTLREFWNKNVNATPE